MCIIKSFFSRQFFVFFCGLEAFRPFRNAFISFCLIIACFIKMSFVQSISLSSSVISSSISFASRLNLPKNLNFLSANLIELFMSLSIGFNWLFIWSLVVLCLQYFLSSSKKNFFCLLYLKTLPNGEYSNLACSTTPGLCPKSSPVRYSYLSNSLDDNVEMLAALLSKSYWAWFVLILSLRILSSSVCHFLKDLKQFLWRYSRDF